MMLMRSVGISVYFGQWLPLRNAVVLAVAVVLAHVLLFDGQARAHLWYPKACCNDQDCFRATRVEHLPDGSLRIYTDHLSVIVPPTYVSFPSQDNDAHVCVYRDIRGRYHPRCVFLPGIG